MSKTKDNTNICNKCGNMEFTISTTPTTEQCFCQSYIDDDNELQDCTCGKCDKPGGKPVILSPTIDFSVARITKKLYKLFFEGKHGYGEIYLSLNGDGTGYFQLKDKEYTAPIAMAIMDMLNKELNHESE